MQVASQFFVSFAFMQTLMCGLLLLPYLFNKEKGNEAVILYFILMCCSASYLLPKAFAEFEHVSVVYWLNYIGGNALPGAFWLVAITVFSEHIKPHSRYYILASTTLIIPMSSLFLQWLFSYELTQGMTLYSLIKYGAMTLELTLIAHALFIAIKYWRDDLVEQRRYIRGVVISLSALYIFVVIVVEQILKLQWQYLYPIKSLLLLLLLTVINLILFRLRPNSLFIIDNKSNTSHKTLNKAVAKQSKELTAILDAMNKDLLYQQEGITITSFARHLGIHEYKLRQLINGELNYRNFNDFLNFYRIKEVSEKLVQAEYIQTPVITLALESGFRSLSSFNKAFKQTHNITPTQYRKKYQ